MAAAAGSEVKRETLEACLKCGLCNKMSKEATAISLCLHTFCRKCIFDKLSEEEYDRCPVCDIYLGNLPVTKLRPDHTLQNIIAKIFPVERKKVDAPEIKEHEAKNSDVTPSSLGGCRFSAEEPVEIDDSTEDIQ